MTKDDRETEGGPRTWRTLEERGRAEPEEPRADVATVTRRGFLGALGASLALVGGEGCRRAVEHVVPYAAMPEEVIPGIPSHYATVYGRRGDAIGLLVESHEGRPTKIEGNPSHPSSLGAADLVAQASILDLYDPDRSKSPEKKGEQIAWDAADAELAAALAGHAKDGGAKLRLLLEPLNSPTQLRLRAAILARFPKARVHTYAPIDDSGAREGARLVFGKPVRALPSYDAARAIVSLDCDFLQTEPGAIRAHKLFSSGRKLASPRDPMSRLYVVEPSLTTTGGAADHRLRLPASQVERYAVALCAELARAGVALGQLGTTLAALPKPDGIPAKWLTAVAKDLAANAGRALVVAGSRQPPVVHALAHVMNHALGGEGKTVDYAPVADPDERENVGELRALALEMEKGSVDTLLIVGGNPVYDAPSDLAFGDTLAKVALAVHFSHFSDETSAKCGLHLPRAHELEAWSDQLALDGAYSVQQPLIAPLWGARSDVELLAQVADSKERKPYELVRATARELLLGEKGRFACAPPEAGTMACKDAAGGAMPTHVSVFEHAWKKALADGVVARTHLDLGKPALRTAELEAELSKRSYGARPTAGLEVTFAPCAKLVDGRHANNSWLLELPCPVTKLSWDNAALLSPATAKELGVTTGDLLRLTRAERTITVAAFVLPGQADRSIGLSVGWGRTHAGRLGNGRGFDVYPLRTADAMHFATDLELTKSGGQYAFAQTQHHDHMEGRPIALEATYEEYAAKPNFPQIEAPPVRSLPLWRDQDYSHGHQWGMSIDLNACTGCSACIVACQSENNIPVVGKEEIERGRTMQWIRLDRYFVDDAERGATVDDPLVSHQPVACVQCEEAPCENVCPVTATVHSGEGLAEVVYNRCVGTRYCANNCPYKVRRFNYLNWHNDSVWKDTGGLPETLQMQQNPNVTVRFRGVIEKCTYCVQRIQSERLASRRDRRKIRDGEIVSACQQTCPADAIVFGDLNDLDSRVAKLSMADRRYALLEELGTKPRTTYLGKVRNPNPEMAG